MRKDIEVYTTLNRQQKVGVERYEDLLQRIPRDEVSALADVVASVVTKVSDGDVTATACGSYRRGASSFCFQHKELTTKPQYMSWNQS